jgi:hypothetical protein
MSFYYGDDIPVCPVPGCGGTEYGPFDIGRPGAPFDQATATFACWVCLDCGYCTTGDPRSPEPEMPDAVSAPWFRAVA